MNKARELFQKFNVKYVKFDTPCVIVGVVDAIKEVEGKHGVNKLYVLQGSFASKEEEFEGKISFFDSASSLRTQLQKLNVQENDEIEVYYYGLKVSPQGNEFKSFYVKNHGNFLNSYTHALQDSLD